MVWCAQCEHLDPQCHNVTGGWGKGSLRLSQIFSCDCQVMKWCGPSLDEPRFLLLSSLFLVMEGWGKVGGPGSFCTQNTKQSTKKGLRTGPDSIRCLLLELHFFNSEQSCVNVLNLVMAVQGFCRVCSCKAEYAHSVLPALA